VLRDASPRGNGFRREQETGRLSGSRRRAASARRGRSIGRRDAGKQADLVVIDGNPSTRIDDIRKVTLVFKQGVAYDPAKHIASVKGRVGVF
jgi:hypothetical protein